MGLPSVITIDQGKEFRNGLNALPHPMETFRVHHRTTTTYHPQANGIDKRYNQTLVNAVAKFAKGNRDAWDKKLEEVVYAYNTAVHDLTRHTLFEVMFGWMAKTVYMHVLSITSFGTNMIQQL